MSASDSQSKSESPPAEPKPIRRLQIAGNVAAQLLLLVVLFGIANYLNARHHRRWDLSANKKYTLDEQSAGFLSSLDTRVHITMAFLGSSKIALNLKAMLEEYRRLSKGKITLDVFDPARDRNRATEASERYDMPLERSMVILEVGPGSDKVGRIKTITEEEMLSADGRLFRGEDAITSALFAATEGEQKVVYFITGHGPIRQSNGRDAFDELQGLSKSQFFRMEKLNLADVSEIPDDADALFILNASLDFSEREIGMLRAFWDAERGALIAMLAPGGTTPRFDAFLSDFGVTPRDDRLLVASDNGTIDFAAQGQFMPGSPITGRMQGSTTTFHGPTCSLQVLEDNATLTRRGIGITALLQASPRFWGETDYRSGFPMLDANDNKPPLFMAAAIEKGASEDMRLRLDASRMIVIGNGTILDPDNITRPNLEFVLGGLNWMLDREQRIGIVAKAATVHRVEITPQQHQRLFTIAVFVLPGAAFCFGLCMWSARRQ